MYVYVTADGNNYYRTYSTTKLQNELLEIEMNSIPNEIDDVKRQFYKLITTVNLTEQVQHYMDSNSQEISEQKIYVPSSIYRWEFDENSYSVFVEMSGYVPVKTNEELMSDVSQSESRLSVLQEDSASKDEEISQLYLTMDDMLLNIIPNIGV